MVKKKGYERLQDLPKKSFLNKATKKVMKQWRLKRLSKIEKNKPSCSIVVNVSMGYDL